MQTRSSLQRRSNSESSDRVVVHIKPRSWGDETHEQPQTVQPKNTGFDFKNADWFSHDPGPRSPVRVFNTIQAKLTVGAPNDQYEQEADRVAEQVMSTPDSAVQQPIQRDMAPEEDKLQTKPLAATITPLVQREMAPEEEEEPELIQGKLIQREMAPEEEEETEPVQGKLIQREAALEDEEEPELVQGKPALQRKESSTGFQAQSGLEQQLDSSKGSGSPLPDDVRSFMEPRFGADFSQVRVHTGSESVQMNRDLNAQAFTHKQDVYFGAGKAPTNDTLTAHELTHVVQQMGMEQANIAKISKVSDGHTQVQHKCDVCEQKDTETLQEKESYPEVSSASTDFLQKVAGVDDAAEAGVLLKVLMNCVTGALVTVAIDEGLQIGTWAWKKWWKKQDVEFRQDWCKTVISALFGCVFGVAGGAFERMFFAEAAETTGKAVLIWIARKAKILGYTFIAGKIGQVIAKAGCADLEADVSSLRTVE